MAAVLTGSCLALHATAGRAQPAQPTQAAGEDAAALAATQASDKPWAQGVSKAEQAAALAAFQEGNEYFAGRRYALALEHYRSAIGHWPHPAIHFNMAVCLVHLELPIEAFAHIQRALTFDDGPLGEALYAEGLTYEKLLADRLGRLSLSATQSGVEVSVDGQPWLTDAGSEARVVLPGRHQLVGTLDGHLTLTRALQVQAGEALEVEVELLPTSAATVYERRFDVWVPWAVVGAGALVGVAGLGLRSLAEAKLQAYDRGVAAACPQGCSADDLPATVADEKHTGETLDGVALGTLGLGAAALLTGVTLVLLNQPRAVESPAPLAGLQLGPTLTRGTRGVQLSGAF